MNEELERELAPSNAEPALGGLKRLHGFFGELRSEIYPEPPSELHTRLTKRMITHLFDTQALPDRALVLDVGCGQGPALEEFCNAGHRPVGIALGPDVAHCREKGFDVFPMDQSFLDFDEGSFDLVWCRHALEHSPIPLFTLSEFRRVLLPNGLLYVEVPAPDTCANHEANPNHYSVFGARMWAELLRKAGFEILESLEMRFPLSIGEDCYFSFFCRRSG